MGVFIFFVNQFFEKWQFAKFFNVDPLAVLVLLLLNFVDRPSQRSCISSLEEISNLLCIPAIQREFVDAGQLRGFLKLVLQALSFGLTFKALQCFSQIVFLQEYFDRLLNLHQTFLGLSILGLSILGCIRGVNRFI